VDSATTRPLYPGERPGTHWVGPRAGLEGWGKFRPSPALDPRTVQPEASRYTDCAITAHSTQTHPAGKWGFGTAPLSFLLLRVMYLNWQMPATLRRSDRLWGPPSLVCKTYRRGGGLFSRKRIGRSVKQTTHLYLLSTTHFPV
jgi:hypothetical protein